MILIDANLLIYAGIQNQINHPAASAWLQAQIQLGHRIGMPWPCLLAFLRIATNPRIYACPATKAQGNLIYDAHLAALAIEHGLEVCSAGSDFSRFEGLRWRNPLP